MITFITLQTLHLQWNYTPERWVEIETLAPRPSRTVPIIVVGRERKDQIGDPIHEGCSYRPLRYYLTDLWRSHQLQ